MPLTTITSADAQRGPVWTTGTILGSRNRAFGITSVAPTSTAWPTNNTAILIPFTVTTPVTFAEMFFQAGTSPGTTNYDLGIYTDTFVQITHLGATAAANTTDAILPVGGGALPAAVTLSRGRYYMAMSAASTGLTVRGLTTTNGVSRAFGCISMATAHPLPATVTPATAVALMPTIGVTTVTNIL